MCPNNVTPSKASCAIKGYTEKKIVQRPFGGGDYLRLNSIFFFGLKKKEKKKKAQEGPSLWVGYLWVGYWWVATCGWATGGSVSDSHTNTAPVPYAEYGMGAELLFN